MRRGGLTLIELVVVVGIVSILATLGMINFKLAVDRSKTSAALSFLSSLETAISMYRVDKGVYPADGRKDPTSSPLEYSSHWLRKDLSLERGDPLWNGPYMNFREKFLQKKNIFDEEGLPIILLIDPWGNPYIYSCNFDDDPRTSPPYHNPYTYDLASAGKEGKWEINNW